ncbi:3-dehydroshikimate dehydratase [Periconia macrospinosa]|uniref:3-dehydroshikimate dehydratase n=1 Tax=Periconia macrospinosa TaxID=97972 RepID=A0A2V1DN98_9PLEO|nr:3-dehydroshikimate dehydratase [Periconia macrospinosa]
MPLLPGISTMSLGRCHAGHSLTYKLQRAAQNGLRGIELFYDDLQALASPPTPSNLLAAASSVRNLCASLNLTIICLQPFMHYGGIIDRAAHARRVEDMRFWIRLARTLGTDIIQVPSSFLKKEECSPDFDMLVEDLKVVADLGLDVDDPMRFVYESLCWGTHVDTWEVCWDVVQAVDRSNFGICLDSFNILGRIYADPTAATGMMPNAEEEVRESMERMVQRIAPFREKIFFVQVVDAERLDAPLVKGHPFYVEGQPPRMNWSRNCRLFYGEKEEGAYLPVKVVLETIFKRIGYEGWVSFELFNRAMERRDEGVVEELASRAARGWRRMLEDLELAEEVKSGAGLRKDSKELEGLGEVARL